MSKIDYATLERKYKVVIRWWNNGFLVKPSERISENESLSSSKAYFMIFQRNGKFGVHINGLLDYNEWLIETKKPVFYPLKSTRLKAANTIDGCLQWINRFRSKSDDEQTEILSRHNLEARDNNLVAIMCDYWRVERFDEKLNTWLKVDSSINGGAMQTLYDAIKNNGKYRLRHSVQRSAVLPKTELQKYRDDKTIYNINIGIAAPKNATMGVSDYNKTPKRNRTARFWNGK